MKALLTALFSFLVSILFAQSNQTEGRIYQNDRKIIPAFFHLKTSEGTPQQFSYSLTNGGERNTLTAHDAEKIELQDGTAYESFFIAVPVLASDYLSRSKTDYEANENNFQGRAFVERIMDGSISFYQFVDRYGFSHFFYRLAADTSLTLLRNKTYVSEGGQVEYDRAYKNQLSFLTSKYCPVAPPEIGRLDYSFKPMVNVITALNACTGSQGNATAYLKKQKAITNMGIMGGVLSSALGLKSYQRSVNPTFGACLDITPGKAYKNYKVSVEASYQSFDQKEDSVIYAISHSQTRAAFSVANLNVMTRFYLSHQQQSPFVEVGPNFNYAFGHTLTTGTKDMVFNSVQTTKLEGGNLFYFGLTGGVGYDFQRLSLHARMGLMMHQNDDWIKNYVGLLAKFRLTSK